MGNLISPIKLIGRFRITLVFLQLTMKIIALSVILFIGSTNCWPSQSKKCGLSETRSLFDESTHIDRQDLIFMTEFSRFMNHKAPELLQEFSLRRKVSDAREKLRRRQYQAEFRTAIRKLEAIKEYSDRQKRAFDIEGRQDDVEEAVEDAVDDTADAVVDVADDVEDTADAVSDVVEDVADAVSDVADEVVDGAGDGVDAVVDAGEGAVDAVGDLADSAGELVGDLIGVAVNSTTGVIDIFTDVVQSVGTALEENLPPQVWNAMCVAVWWPLQEDHCNAARCVACAPSITTAATVCGKTNQAINHKCLEEVMGEGFCNYCIKEYL